VGVPGTPINRDSVLHAFGEQTGEGSLADGWLRYHDKAMESGSRPSDLAHGNGRNRR